MQLEKEKKEKRERERCRALAQRIAEEANPARRPCWESRCPC